MFHHRLARIYETLPASSEAVIYLAMIDNETVQTWTGKH